MKTRSAEKMVRKTYTPPQLVVYGKVSDLTQGGRGGGHGHGGGKGPKHRGGKGRGHGGSRS